MEIKDLILRYGFVLGRRFKFSEKRSFVNILALDFKELGYESKGVLSKDKKYLNLLVGDVSHAPNLVIVNYDTPKKTFNNTFDYPFNPSKSFKNNFIKDNAIVFILMLIGLVYIYYFTNKMYLSLSNYTGYLFIIGLIIISLLIIKLSKGNGTKVNLDKNSIGVVVALDIASHIKDKSKVAFVFSDAGNTNHQGDKMVVEALPKSIKNRNVIHLNGLARNQDLVVGSTVDNKKMAQHIMKHFQGKATIHYHKLSDEDITLHSLAYYPKSCSISTGLYQNKELKVAPIKNQASINLDIDEINSISLMISNYLNNQ